MRLSRENIGEDFSNPVSGEESPVEEPPEDEENLEEEEEGQEEEDETDAPSRPDRKNLITFKSFEIKIRISLRFVCSQH